VAIGTAAFEEGFFLFEEVISDGAKRGQVRSLGFRL
jgi:hypothetical protein